MIFSETIEVSVTFSATVRFFLRMLSLQEEDAYRQSIFGLKKEEIAEKEYAANVALLAQLSTAKPIGLFPNRPDETEEADQTVYAEDFKTPREAIEAFFAEKTVLKERIAYFAVRGYFLKLSPTESFF